MCRGCTLRAWAGARHSCVHTPGLKHTPVVVQVLSNQVPPVQHLPSLLLLTAHQHLVRQCSKLASLLQGTT